MSGGDDGGVAAQHLVQAVAHGGERFLPRGEGAEVAQVGFAQDAVDHVGEDLVLAGEVAVERGGTGAESVGEHTQGEVLDPLLVDEEQGRLDELSGSGIGSFDIRRYLVQAQAYLRVIVDGKITVDTTVYPLSRCAEAWTDRAGPRPVLTAG